jgi:hypothetical protein
MNTVGTLRRFSIVFSAVRPVLNGKDVSDTGCHTTSFFTPITFPLKAGIFWRTEDVG